MIEPIFREIYPKFDPSPIEKIRVSSDPSIREAILWEYGLDDLLPYAIDPETINQEALEFIRTRGTLASIRTAMRWIGFSAIQFVPLSSYEYEVDPGRIPNPQELNAIQAALKVSVQSRGVLKRIFNGSYEVKYG
jgi:hypothetical protein